MSKVYILLDASGSMEPIWQEALGSVDAYVEELLPDTDVYMAIFDSVEYKIVRDSQAKDWKSVLSDGTIKPRGMTPLYDAAGTMMNLIKNQKPDQSLFVVMTDGDENASKQYTQSDVKRLTEDIKSQNCDIVYLGANFDKVSSVAASTGTISAGKSAYISSGNMNSAMRKLSFMTNERIRGAINEIEFDAQYKKDASVKHWQSDQ